MTDLQPCPQCGEPKERLSRHWTTSKECSHPPVGDDLQAVLDGVVLAGGSVGGNGMHRHLETGSTNPELAAWLADELDWLCAGIRLEEPPGEARDPVLRVRTHAHPAIDVYGAWQRPSPVRRRVPPDSFTLGPDTARVWYAFAGSVYWSGPYDSQRKAVFSALNEDRTDWIERVLNDAGFDTHRVAKQVQLSATATTDFVEWVGEAVPGVEYKWAASVIEYRTWRSEPVSRADFEAVYCTEALEVARRRTAQDLTPQTFDTVVDDVDSETVAAVLGGGEWRDALSLAGVPYEGGRKRHSGDPDGTVVGEERSGPVSREEAVDAILEVNGRTETLLSIRRYNELRDGSHPNGAQIAQLWGWNELKREVGLETVKEAEATFSRDDAVAAVSEVAARIDDRLTVERYRENHEPHHPCVATIARRWGWNAIKRAAGLEPIKERQ